MLRGPFFIFLLLMTSCALFKKAPPLTDSNVDTLLNSVRMTGEGRGRISLEQGQNVFSYEAVLKDEGDWLLAVYVPLHGEEVMVLRQIRQPLFTDESDSFEVRLQKEIDSRIKGGDLTGEDYIRELRALIRFILAPQLNLKRECSPEGEGAFRCLLEEDSFLVKVEEQKIFIRKEMKKNYFLELSAENLTDSFFAQTNFHLHSQSTSESTSSVFALDLFWK